MSPDVIAWTLALVATTLPGSSQGECPPAPQAVLAEAAADVALGAYSDAAERVRLGYESAGACATLRLAAWTWRGWLSAAAAADSGGTPDLLAPVNEAIAAVATLGPPRSDAAYAAAVLRAAAASSQDERDEMLVWLEEARALSARLALTGAPPRWPLPIDLVEGELWHRVDDYELAEAAFERAIAAGEGPVAWRGLARARDRRGNGSGACGAYRRVLELLGPAVPRGPLAAEARAYLLICAP